MPGGLPSISYASVVIGFLGFAFTFFTFVRVFWVTLVTLWSAPKELRLYMDNLRSELKGERAYFKTALRQRRSSSQTKNKKSMYDDSEVIKQLSWTTKTLLQRFEEIERPFLREPSKMDEKDMEWSETSSRSDYAPMTLGRRWQWMRSKDEVITMADQVSRIQTRRTGQISSSILTRICAMEKRLRDFDDRLWDLEEQVVGETLDDGNVYVRRKAK